MKQHVFRINSRADHHQLSNWMYVKREQILKPQYSHLEAAVGDVINNNFSWEERAFAEDAARLHGGSMWPQRSYSCTFCTRDFNTRSHHLKKKMMNNSSVYLMLARHTYMAPFRSYSNISCLYEPLYNVKRFSSVEEHWA